MSQILLDGAEPRNCGDDLVVFSSPLEANWRRQPVTQLACLIRTVAKKVKNCLSNSCTEPGSSFYHFATPLMRTSTRYVLDRWTQVSRRNVSFVYSIFWKIRTYSILTYTYPRAMSPAMGQWRTCPWSLCMYISLSISVRCISWQRQTGGPSGENQWACITHFTTCCRIPSQFSFQVYYIYVEMSVISVWFCEHSLSWLKITAHFIHIR